ncbi:nickel-dependent lactate racemase [Paenibacillus sp.]|uniref:nickel-dependent lactate racemase n=1 Tax=Paenibacillus sp. TaxID=58172 RepID=UPI002D723894|nr:nickel-dependent lactate racemase [Paenibacillus sp.]HZG86956.1 nickel-dependent lactate racemase [Paenibacillus sp.]
MRFAYGNDELTVDWRQARPDIIAYSSPPIDDVRIDEALEAALREPIGCPPLSQVARDRKDAVILVSDLTRLCPTARMLPLTLDALNEGGIPDDRIRVVVALGTHRSQTERELLRIAGDAFERVRVLNHSSAPEDCRYIGTTTLGTRIEINRAVLDAELRIAIGNIEPHRLVGVSGGGKALFPGVASSRSIEAHHALSRRFRCVPGFAENPLHRDIEEACAMAPIHFLFNVVADHLRRPLGVFAGDPSEAHREGVRFARRQFLIPVRRRYDVVVASAGGHPKDMQLYQAIKSLENAAGFAEPGGDVLLIARCEEIYGNGVFQTWAETHVDRARAIRELDERFVLGAHKLRLLHRVTQRHNVHLHSDIPEPLAVLLGVRPVYDIQSWIDERLQSHRSIAAIPCAALTFPSSIPNGASASNQV